MILLTDVQDIAEQLNITPEALLSQFNDEHVPWIKPSRIRRSVHNIPDQAI
ncbi:MAG: hypothetical protein NC924_05105 [Candidatus Omnitrophica bacterium]|nr:hypothetical protein [Candidatus Omnitrophota bacterium]